MSRNPFEYQREVTGNLFVNRAKDVEKLVRACANGRNLLLIGPRRLGKTSLIREAFARLDRRTHLPLYVDISKTGQEGDVAQRILDALVPVAFGRSERTWRWLLHKFRRTRPVVRLDPHRGPTFTFDLADAGVPELEDTLELLESAARRRKRRIILAIDEFQRIIERDRDATTIGAIRGVVQHQRHVSYVLSGSKKHALVGLVQDRNEPFWGQLDTMEIGGIAMEHFAPFARRQFAAGGRPIGADALTRIGELCFDNPKRIQELLSGLFDRGRAPTPALAQEILDQQVREHHHHLEDILDDVEEGHQKRLLLALAREGRPVRIFTRRFMEKYRLGGPGFVRRAAESLQRKGILNDDYWFVDPFFFHYLRMD